MVAPEHHVEEFATRFEDRRLAERYRDRYKSGRHAKVHRLEQAALRELLKGIERIPVALDLPSGVGRLTPVLAEVAERVILADSSPIMLEMAREEHPELPAEYIQTDAQNIQLADASVDLLFCHRFLHHIHDRAVRVRLFAELARVTRRYAVLSYYSPGLRTRFRNLARNLIGIGDRSMQPASLREFMREMSAAGFREVRRRVLRPFPYTGLFFLCEKTPT